jgi:hypothetical protein
MHIDDRDNSIMIDVNKNVTKWPEDLVMISTVHHPFLRGTSGGAEEVAHYQFT